jgi:hypothetical protein
MLQFQHIEVLLQLPHTDEVGCELGIIAAALPPDLPDNELRVSFDQELPDPRHRAAVSPKIKASYSTMLLVASKSR